MRLRSIFMWPLPLRGEQMNSVVGAFTHVVANHFAGSLFDLEPDTEYEVQLTQSDADGVQGAAQQTATIQHFEGMTLRNTEVAIQAGYKGLIGSEGLIVNNTRYPA